MRLFSLGVASLLVLTSSLLAEIAPLIRTGDVFEMRLSGMPQDVAADFAVQYTVGQEGTVNVPFIGGVKVSGLTPAQVEREMQAKLIAGKIFTHPTVIINVLAGSRFVFVGGGVKSPQRLQWTQDLTLHTAVGSAGGLDDYADPKGVRLIRDGKIVRAYDLRLLEKDPSQDPKLLPGDQVYVRKQ
jgi:protein involved in polysaccharide export with SLBB domain